MHGLKQYNRIRLPRGCLCRPVRAVGTNAFCPGDYTDTQTERLGLLEALLKFISFYNGHENNWISDTRLQLGTKEQKNEAR